MRYTRENSRRGLRTSRASRREVRGPRQIREFVAGHLRAQVE